MSERLDDGKAEDIDRQLADMRREAAEIILETTRKICEAEHLSVEIEETPETITLILKDPDGKVEREMGFTKVRRLPLGDVEEVVEARLRFPDYDMEEAVAKIRKERKRKQRD